MGIKHSLTFGGINTDDYGIWITGAGTFAAPERDVEYVSVPGRNGDLIIDNNRWRNIEIAYPANIPNGFDAKLSAFRSAICRLRGYQRLEDSYHMDEFRMASFAMGLQPEPIPGNRGGQFDIVFNCKPQRFLKSGEMPLQFMPWVTPTYRSQYIPVSGSAVTFEAHVPEGDEITVMLSTYDSSLTQLRTVSESVGNGDLTSFAISAENERFWRIEITNGVTDAEAVTLQLKFDLDYFTTGIKHVNATFGQYFTLKNPTGYAAKPLIDYWAQIVPYTTWENYENGELQYYYEFHSTWADVMRLYMNCELQYLYDNDKNNMSSHLFLNTSGSGIGEGIVFPELSADETRLDMSFTTSDIDNGPGIVNIYPNWWKL